MPNRPIHTILIANRGEIARRIIRTCQEMGIRTVAICSESDRQAPFVQEADTAFYLGGNTPSESYLNQEKIIEAAQKTGADAIHPGYGFLSENAAFAKRCQQSGLTFIGPEPESIEKMGSKALAKELMQIHKVPVIPGYQGDDQSLDTLIVEAEKIGYPVLIKAAAGGGGKGMRIVNRPDEFEAAWQSARREAMQAFGDEFLILEKYFLHARHIEFQIFGDEQGNYIHLFERECSIQRRHQKIIEESPSPFLAEEVRQQMGMAAVRAAKALNYRGAGTVEFILTEDQQFYFLEVNTRLQVEHPVTEAITGLDLVRMQIEVAEGKPLKVAQNELKSQGYALECRLYAEDPTAQFMPDSGEVLEWNCPEIEGIRVDSGIETGSEVGIHYDPMLAKIIAHGANREEAIRKMCYFMQKMRCMGLKTNQEFLIRLLQDNDFQKGHYHTNYLYERPDLLKKQAIESKAVQLSAIALTLFRWQLRDANRRLASALPSGWRNNYYAPQQEMYQVDGEQMTVYYHLKGTAFEFQFNDYVLTVSDFTIQDGGLSFFVENVLHYYVICQKGEDCYIQSKTGGQLKMNVPPRFQDPEKSKQKGGYEAPMPAEVVAVLVKEGEVVEVGQPLVILSSMKMENTLTAEEKGTIKELFIQAGEHVAAGQLLLKLQSKESELSESVSS